MTEYLFTFQSLTQAQSGLSILKKRGIFAELRRTPKPLASRGCGYSIAVGEQTVRSAAATLHGYGFDYNRVYRHRNGTVEEVLL